jgi:hypothetical protein
MNLQAHFSDIRAVIAGELDAAAESVVAAVAWLTDPVLLEALVKAARRGCRVQLALLDDAINRPSGAKLEQVRAAGGGRRGVLDSRSRARGWVAASQVLRDRWRCGDHRFL